MTSTYFDVGVGVGVGGCVDVGVVDVIVVDSGLILDASLKIRSSVVVVVFCLSRSL